MSTSEETRKYFAFRTKNGTVVIRIYKESLDIDKFFENDPDIVEIWGPYESTSLAEAKAEGKMVLAGSSALM